MSVQGSCCRAAVSTMDEGLWDVEVQLHTFLASALGGGVKGQLHVPAAFFPAKEAPTIIAQ
jgi:hypothetical protein